ncbi:hypothetical protein ElyMa_006785400 [Elysia marginata]|uniref:Uncharacterized protein n=1 Tax=Elysia marginata TaxID=1093978 RepID=A0AAV4J0V4_9GAST|nr:hypothetical protein ElyMa_006785400 [Elysia marginata]
MVPSHDVLSMLRVSIGDRPVKRLRSTKRSWLCGGLKCLRGAAAVKPLTGKTSPKRIINKGIGVTGLRDRKRALPDVKQGKRPLKWNDNSNDSCLHV